MRVYIHRKKQPTDFLQTKQICFFAQLYTIFMIRNSCLRPPLKEAGEILTHKNSYLDEKQNMMLDFFLII